MPNHSDSDHESPEGRSRPNPESGGMDKDLHELFLDQLADIYDAEQQLTKALPQMANAADSAELKETFESHVKHAEQHIARIEQVARSLKETLKQKACHAMKGLIEESDDIIKEQRNSSALDAGLIAIAQKMEHHQLAGYATLCVWAEDMGHQEALHLLRQTAEEESAIDEELTSVGESIEGRRIPTE